PGFTNLTISRDLYTQLTAGARTHGDSGIPNYLTWLLSGSPGKIDGSTVLRTEGVQNEIPFAKAQVGGPGGIRTHDLRLRRPPSWSWLDYRPLRRATDSFPYNAIISTQSEIRLVTSDSRTVSYASEKGEMDSHVYLQQVSEARIPDHSVVRD